MRILSVNVFLFKNIFEEILKIFKTNTTQITTVIKLQPKIMVNTHSCDLYLATFELKQLYQNTLYN